MVSPNRRYEPQLVGRRFVENQRAVSAQTGCLIMDHIDGRRFDSEVSAIPGKAAQPGKAFTVIAEANLVVRIVVAAVAEDHFALTIAFESGTRHYVEDTVGAVAVLSTVSATLHFEVVDILGIKLRSHVRRDIGVRHGHTVE